MEEINDCVDEKEGCCKCVCGREDGRTGRCVCVGGGGGGGAPFRVGSRGNDSFQSLGVTKSRQVDSIVTSGA